MDAERQVPCGVDHLVLYVDDIERSHEFWAGRLGFKHVGTTPRTAPNERALPGTRVYSGARQGELFHHNIALMQRPRTDGQPAAQQINHIAIGYADPASWRKQVAFLESTGVELRNKVMRGTIYSVLATDPDGYTVEIACELDRHLWEDDINAALNKAAVPID